MNNVDINDRPKWLLELENRKRKPRLAHEAGAGAPCVLCKISCPGLDLHFWRKICKNCKCNKDDHDVDDDDFPQFDLLFGTSKKYKKKSILLHINDGKKYVEEAFEWIPPNTTKELAVDYMRALPIDKLPIKGSAGAALRRQLLQKQLPLHDIDYKNCDKLSDQEKKQFEKYLENIKRYVGQGIVTKILSARPYDGSLVTPVNATDMQRFNPQNKLNLSPSFVQLRTPSSFAPKCSYKKNVHENINVHEFCALEAPNNYSNIKNNQIFEKYNITSNDNESIRSSNQNIKNVTSENLNLNDTVVTNVNSKITLPSNSSECYKEAYKDIFKNPSTSILNSKSINDNIDVETLLVDALLPSSVHTTDVIKSTLDEKSLMYIREKLTNKYSNQENQKQINIPNFAKNLDSNNSQNKNFPININKETDQVTTITTINNPEMLIPSKEKFQNIEKNTYDSTETLNIENSKENKSLTSSKMMENQFLSSTSSSQQSSNINNYEATLNSFTTPSTIIHSEKLEKQIFPYETISTAKQSEDLINAEHLKNVMDQLTINSKLQKCHKCKEEIHVGDVAVITEKAKNAIWHPGCFLIFVREYTVAEGHNYHVKHFCCWDCDVPLAGKQYITENDRPLCLLCYQKSYAKTCNLCNKIIAADQKGVAVKDLNFHATEACFCCYICNKNLLSSKFAVKEKKIFCSKECISNFLHSQITN
ncbi:testin isoform X2 [Apis mellifera]|uniref:Testin isoform X2 n=1 Tax=Apis mellifera TaxID=7460 RepID=A0A7M7MWI2_APIME|nr:testin isoform X2 [Apis mellifera]|eukprot:XP_026302174.1 testin isoform X2 [Apis mellifera]